MNDKEGEERKGDKQGEREYNDEETRTQNSSLYRCVMKESSGENKEEECCSDEKENNKRMKGDDSNDGERKSHIRKGNERI